MFGAQNLSRVFNPGSIAIIGASADPRSFGGFMQGNLERNPFSGDLHLVSRSSDSINGHPCVKTIEELPTGIDLAVLAIPESGVLAAIASLGLRSCHAAVLFASGYAEAGEEGQAKQAVLAQAAIDAGIVLIGPNCMGFTNLATSMPVTFEPLPQRLIETRPGIAVAAQSGFMAATLRDAFLGRELPVTAVFSTGNEAGVTMEDALAHYLADTQVRVITVYAEQIRKPALFLQLADEARRLGKPIVLLMPGRSARAREAAQSHTGALAGDHAASSALLLSRAVVMADSLDELLDVSAVLLHHPRPPAGGTAFMTGSGAMKNIALDFADAIGLQLPVLSDHTTAQLTAMLPAYAVAENPLDYTTIGVRQPGLIGELMLAMQSDASIANMVLAIPVGPVVAQHDKAMHIVPALAKARKPTVLVLTGDASPIEPFFLEAIAKHGVCLFRSADRALRALARVAQFGEALQRAERAQSFALASAHASSAPLTLGQPPMPLTLGVYPEYLGKTWLSSLGLPVPPGQLVTSAEEAVQAAHRLGYPLVIKAQASALPHKSDVGGVIVGIQDADGLRSAWARLHSDVARHRPDLTLDGVLLETMGARGLELVVGAKRVPGWGAVVLVGLGGIWIEALHDVRLIPAGMAVPDIVVELGRLKAAAVLRGLRGAAGVDFEAIAQVVALIGAQMLAHPEITEIDINPLIAYPLGAPIPVLALDALVVVP